MIGADDQATPGSPRPFYGAPAAAKISDRNDIHDRTPRFGSDNTLECGGEEVEKRRWSLTGQGARVPIIINTAS